LIEHLKGLGILPRRVSVSIPNSTVRCTHATTPEEYSNEGSMICPSASMALVISKTVRMYVTASQSEEVAMWRPGQMLMIETSLSGYNVCEDK
jgi:hypothetical protein